MRTGALITLIICELLTLMLLSIDINADNISFLSTLVVVVIVAFSFSALLQNIKSLAMSKKYGISGLLGVLVGVLYFWWAGAHVNSLVVWLSTYGIYFLFFVIFLCAMFLYLNKGNKKETQPEEVQELN